MIRSEKKISLLAKVQAKPKETSAFAEVFYEEVPFDNGSLRSIIELPKDTKNPPVLFYLQGFGCSSIDLYYNDQDPIKQFTEGLTKLGIAVYRVEKPGLGDSKNDESCEEIGYHKEVLAFEKALAKLKQDPRIDGDRIFLFGHSLGGVTAPLLVERIPVAGIINYGSVFGKWYDYLLRVVKDQAAVRGKDPQIIKEEFEKRQPLLYDSMILKKTPEVLSMNPEYKKIMSTGLPLIEGDKAIGRHYRFMQEINEADTKEALKNANTYVLAIHGEHDIHAIDASWAQHTAEWVNSFYPGKAEWKVLPNTEHSFAKVASMKENIRLRDLGEMNNQYYGENFDTEIIPMVAGFIKNHSTGRTK